MSNNFVTPRAVATLSQSRIDYNNSLLTLLQNFSSSGQPSASSVNLEGVTGLKQGMLWYKAGSNTADGQGRLTIYDGANFVRTGIAVYRMPSGAVANVAIGNNKITSGELIDIGDNRLYMVNASNTGYVDVGLPPTGYTVDNAQTLDSLDSTQFLRSDVADTIEGPLTGEPMLRLTNTTTNSLSVASLWLSGDRGALLFDSTGNKRITWNDTTNQFSIRAGAYTDGSLRYTTTGDGIADLNFFHESTHGGFILRIADIGTAGATPVWTQTLVLNNTGLALNSNTIWHAGNDGPGSGLDADTLDGTQLTTIQGAYAANDGVTLATARGNDHATLLSARANDLSTYNTLVSEYRANDWNTLSTARANDLATLTSAQANDWNTLATARANDLSTYNTLVSEYRANDWNTFSTLSANDGVTLSTAIANDFATFTTLSANDWNTLSTARANDGTTLATARGNDHSTLLSARSNDFATFTTLSANDWNTFTTLSANDGVVRSLAIANDYNGYLTFRGEFLGNDHSTLLSARANDFSTWSGLNDYINLKANINAPSFSGGISVGNSISSNASNGVLVIYGGSGFGGANIELYGPDHPSLSNRIYYDAFVHTFRSNTGSTYMTLDEGNITAYGVDLLANDGATLLSARANDFATFSTLSANDGATLATARGNDHATLLSARANDFATFSTLSANDGATLATARGNDHTTLLSARANDFSTFTTLSANDFNTLISATNTANANIFNTFSTLSANDGATLSTAIANDGVTIASARANDFATFSTLSANDGTTLATARGNDHATLLTARANDFATWSGLNAYVNIKANIASPTFTGTVNAPTFNATSLTDGGFQGIATDTAAQPSYTWTGDLSTGIFRPGANTIGLTTAGVERVRVTSLGRVGIGVTNPAVELHVTGNILTSFSLANSFLLPDTAAGMYRLNGADAASGNLIVTAGGSDSNMLLYESGNTSFGLLTNPPERLSVSGNVYAVQNFYAATTGGSEAIPTFSWRSRQNTGMFSPAANTIGFTTAGTEAVRITSAGNVAIGRTTAGANVDVIGTIRASTGILFGTDTAAANILDDYEEGTWTAQVYDSLGGSPSTTTAVGNYTKIGDLVFASVTGLNNINLAGFTPSFTINVSLPFTSRTGTGYVGSILVDSVTFPAGTTSLVADIGASTDRVTIRASGNAVADENMLVSNFTSNVSDIVRISVVYRGV